jgi:hypothetical protein
VVALTSLVVWPPEVSQQLRGRALWRAVPRADFGALDAESVEAKSGDPASGTEDVLRQLAAGELDIDEVDALLDIERSSEPS